MVQQEVGKPGSSIATFFQRDPQRTVPALSEGWPAVAMLDRRDPSRQLMGVRVRPGLPPRARIIDAGAEGEPIANVLMPVADGPGLDPGGQPAWFIIAEAPPGPAINLAGGPWREQDLIAAVLLPAAAALEALRERGYTHRGIRPDNLFRAAPGRPVTLGPFWAAPPGTGQPPVADPPFLGWCRTACQGDGCIADDVFALGVTLLALSMGHWPLTGMDPQEILQRSLSAGSFATLTAGYHNLPSFLGDLLRGMLAEDPDHRPSPALLLDPLRAAARRASARPPRRAARQIDVGSAGAGTARELGFAIAMQPEPASELLRSGAIDRWLRRSLNDPTLAGKLEEACDEVSGAAGDGGRAASLLLMLAISVLEPLAPLVWRGAALWPDSLGTAMIGADAVTASCQRELIEQGVLTQWAAIHPRRGDSAELIEQARDWAVLLATRGAAGGLNRLLYGLNPLLACASPLLAGRPVLRLPELLPALEAASARADRRQPPIDAHITAFIAARAEQSMKAELSGLNSFTGEAERPLVLRLYSRLQTRLDCGPLPGLAAWLHEAGYTGLDRWRSRSTRIAQGKRIATLVAGGQLGALVTAVEDSAALAADLAASVAAMARMEYLRQRLQDSEANAARRIADASRLAHDISAGAGLLSILGAALSVAIG
jgi:hypothetical protein